MKRPWARERIQSRGGWATRTAGGRDLLGDSRSRTGCADARSTVLSQPKGHRVPTSISSHPVVSILAICQSPVKPKGNR